MPEFDDILIIINSATFTDWRGVNITMGIDSVVDAFSVSGTFDKDNPIWRTIKPFGYQPVIVYIGAERVITGTIDRLDVNLSAGERNIVVQGRSTPGALIDCSIDDQGFEFSNMTLQLIANRLCLPYGVVTLFPSGDTDPIKEARAEVGQTVADFLVSMAQPKNLLVYSNEYGNLVFNTPSLPVPMAYIAEGLSPLVAISASYDGQKRYSKYKIVSQQDGAASIEAFTLDPSILKTRPNVDRAWNLDGKDINKESAWRASTALNDSIGISVTLSGWRNPSGAMWRKGSYVVVNAPSVMINLDTMFEIKRVTLQLDESEGQVCNLDLVLPETFNATLPAVYPWA